MFLLNSSQIFLPKRAHACIECRKSFEKEEEYISSLFDSEWVRKDYCLFCWDKETKKEGVHWKAKMVPKNLKKLPLDEKAFLLFKNLLLEKNHAKNCYILALYLERRKQIIRRTEDKKSSLIYFEIPETGEIAVVSSFSLSFQEGQVLLRDLKEAFEEQM